MYMPICLLLFLVCHFHTIIADPCLADEICDEYLFHGSKSAYHYMRGLNANANYARVSRNCTPIQIFVVARHGTRLPKLKLIPKMQELWELRDHVINNHQNSYGNLDWQQLQALSEWQLDPLVIPDNENMLVDQGKEDLKGLGKRLNEAFPHFLHIKSKNFLGSNFLLKTSNTSRTKLSMTSFIQGLSGDRINFEPTDPYCDRDLLQSYKTCSAWRTASKNKEHLIEYNRLNSHGLMLRAIRDISSRLGFRNSLSLDTVDTIFEMCRFDKAWRIDRTSPWCAAFNGAELRLFEYREDLEYYYESGPGSNVNINLGCLLLRNMLEHFSVAEHRHHAGQPTNPKGVIYFTHSTMIQTLMAAMGFKTDSQPLRSDNYRYMKDRKWRTSWVVPFAASLVAVFYECNGNPCDNRVMMHWAERLLDIEGCDQGLCRWDYLKSLFGDWAFNCNRDFCNA